MELPQAVTACWQLTPHNLYMYVGCCCAPCATAVALSAAAPEAVDDTYPQEPTGPTTVTVPVTQNDTVPCGADAVVTVVTPPSHGTLMWQANNAFTYTPTVPGTPNKDDMFQYQVGQCTLVVPGGLRQAYSPPPARHVLHVLTWHVLTTAVNTACGYSFSVVCCQRESLSCTAPQAVWLAAMGVVSRHALHSAHSAMTGLCQAAVGQALAQTLLAR